MKRTLYDITADLQAFDQLLDQAGGDVSDIQVLEAIEQWMADLDADLTNKVDGYAAYINDLLATAKARKEEANRLRTLATAGENTVRRLKERLMWAFKERDIKKLETPRFVVSWQNNGGKKPLDVQVPGNELAPRFQKVVVDPDNDAIRSAIEAGEEVAGCTLMERGTSLRIR